MIKISVPIVPVPKVGVPTNGFWILLSMRHKPVLTFVNDPDTGMFLEVRR